ncbi:MAG: hypothetical protein U5K27_02205 [Desulfotignum sp.]|nr:hypothetical protein [Desulfotignum sp.]
MTTCSPTSGDWPWRCAMTSGKDPDTRITASGRAGQVSVEDMALTLDRELRTRYTRIRYGSTA